MTIQKLLFILVFILIAHFGVFAWGYIGHQIVAQLAMHQLSNATRIKVLKVLGDMTPEQAGTWMDDTRSDHSYDYMKPWHYLNLEKGDSYVPAKEGDIMTALAAAYTDLQHIDTLSPEQVRKDVLILFHLCGDLMQPLHVGYGSDKGGNTYQVQYNGKGTNLHHIWDTDIIESQGIMLTSLQDTSKTPSAADIKLLRKQPIDFMTWMNKSRSLLPTVYDFKGHKLDEIYMQKNKIVVEMQLRNGGTLLAACLEQLFSQVTDVPEALPATKQQADNGKMVPATGGTITAGQAPNHMGETATVCGKVYGTKFLASSEGPTFINMGGDYPNNPFTVVIMFKDRSNFSYKPEAYLQGKTICVTGKIKEYKGKAEMIVDKEEQVTIQ